MKRVINKRVINNRFALAGLVLVALAALYGAAGVSRPAGTIRFAEGRAQVVSSVAACPAPAGGRVSALTPPGAGTQGRAEVAPTSSGDRPEALTSPGTVWYQDIRKAKSSYTARASGSLAGGLVVEQTSITRSGGDRGIAGVRCAEPGTDMWFVGPGPADAEDIDLHVTNVDGQPAAFDVEAISGEGPLDTPDGRGTAVQPYSDRLVRIGEEPEGLGDIVRSAAVVALRVRATTGRVAASVRVRMGSKKGIEWTPVTPRPGADFVVPGIPAGSGSRQLLIAVPGEADATVRVRVVTSRGMYAPEGQDIVEAPAQTVTPIDLAGALGGKPAAVRLTSNQPITAAFVARIGLRGGRQEIAMGAAVPALEQSGVIADNRSRSGTETRLIITAPDADATVRITPITEQGPVTAQDVEVRGGRTVEVRPRPPAEAEHGYGLVITPLPGSGAVYAARILTDKSDGLTVLPVGPAPVWVRTPPVGDSLTALIR